MIPTTGKRRPRPKVWHVRLYAAGRTPQLARLVALDMRLDG